MFSKLSKNYRLKFVFCFVFLLYFFSNNIIYANLKNNNEYLIPIGNVLQIDAELDGILVRNKVKNSPFNIGDKILSVNNLEVHTLNDFSSALSKLDSNTSIDVLINRGFRDINIKTNKNSLEQINFNNMISGYATLTYIDPKTNEFGAVAHSISIGNSNDFVINQGTISDTINLNVIKSQKGFVGSLNATKNQVIGQFNENSNFGIKGHINDFNFSQMQHYKVANLNEVKLGKAHIILQNKNNVPQKYEINILNIENQRSAKSKTFKVEVVDKELLSMTGGIVQGMSGTPIVQDDKIVGAISHALENDPATGYGVYIKWMMK